MKNQLTQTDRLFLDRPLPAAPRGTSRAAALHLVGFDRTDYADSFLRVFLALCLLISLAVCSYQLTASAAPATKAVAEHTAVAPTALVCSTPRTCRDVL